MLWKFLCVLSLILPSYRETQSQEISLNVVIVSLFYEVTYGKNSDTKIPFILIDVWENLMFIGWNQEGIKYNFVLTFKKMLEGKSAIFLSSTTQLIVHSSFCTNASFKMIQFLFSLFFSGQAGVIKKEDWPIIFPPCQKQQQERAWFSHMLPVQCLIKHMNCAI